MDHGSGLELSKSQLMLDLDRMSAGNNEDRKSANNLFPQMMSERHYAAENLSTHHLNNKTLESRSSNLNQHRSNTPNNSNEIKPYFKNAADEKPPRPNLPVNIPTPTGKIEVASTTRVPFKHAATTILPDKADVLSCNSSRTKIVQSQSGMMPPLYQHKGRASSQRSSKSVRQPHFSPINERRTEQEKEQAKERTMQRKRALKMKRELTHTSQDVFN